MNENNRELSSAEELRYMRTLAEKYPNTAFAASEIIRIEALLRLPKGTEHFMSDLHGENEAFIHILNSASGVIREKIDVLFAKTVSARECARGAQPPQLCPGECGGHGGL